MYISRIRIQNFRNFADLDMHLTESAVIVGENKVGKSNLLYALRLVLDPTLPDSARLLRPEEDIWEGVERPFKLGDHVAISVELSGWEGDDNLEALLTEHIVDQTPGKTRLTYVFQPNPTLTEPPEKEQDWVFRTFAGDDPDNTVGFPLRTRLPIQLFNALRDVEGDLGNWRRSPLRPLIDAVAEKLDAAQLKELSEKLVKVSEDVSGVKEIATLASEIQKRVLGLVGERHSPNPDLGLAPTEPNRVLRMLRLLIDGGDRPISDASTGSLNILFFALKSLELEQSVTRQERDHTFLAIEEPESHLHPHVQRLLFGALLNVNEPPREKSTVLLTTHSPNIASVAPLKTLAVLRRTKAAGTIGRSTARVKLTDQEVWDLERYIDVNRAEFLFASGVLFIEGDSERYIVPALAHLLGAPLDRSGISLCPITGTNFRPYAQLLGPDALDIPYAIITDLDPQPDGVALGVRRALTILHDLTETEDDTHAVPDDFIETARGHGIFMNSSTLELELLKVGWHKPIQETLLELAPSKKARKRAELLPEAPDVATQDRLLKDIKTVGKGRFAQRLASKIEPPLKCPAYIDDAIAYVTSRI